MLLGIQAPAPHDDLLMAGTLGAIVAHDGKRFVLSNNHVLANENALAIGTEILQPGPLDHGDVATDVIARLAQFVPLTLDTPNHLDCAVAEITDLDVVRARALAKVGRLASDQPIDGVEGMRVEKVGRGSGYTVGEVFDVAASVQLQYDLGLLTFVDQLLIRGVDGAFSQNGDSGALVVDEDSRRGTGGEFSIANHFRTSSTRLE